jgi:hypothetical protein
VGAGVAVVFIFNKLAVTRAHLSRATVQNKLKLKNQLVGDLLTECAAYL